jgi:hypothetical protein
MTEKFRGERAKKSRRQANPDLPGQPEEKNREQKALDF